MKQLAPSRIPLLEVCCGSINSALAAVAGGATRIELCSALSADGLTPSIGVLLELRHRFPDLAIHVLVRPREGNFVYSEAEVLAMERDIHAAAAAGATAIVGGALTPEGSIDVPTTRRLLRAAGGLPFTFHRAFDQVADPESSFRTLASLGVHRILTSGCAGCAEAGIPLLRRLVQLSHQMQPAPTILPAGGVNRHNAQSILCATGATEIHGSLSVLLPEGIRQTSADEVRATLVSLADVC